MSLNFFQKKNLKLRYEQYYSMIKILDAESVTDSNKIPVFIKDYNDDYPIDDEVSALTECVNAIIVSKSNLVILNSLNDAMNETIKYINDKIDELAVIPKCLNKIASSNEDNLNIFAIELATYITNIHSNLAQPSNDGFDLLSNNVNEYLFLISIILIFQNFFSFIVLIPSSSLQFDFEIISFPIDV